MPARRLAAKPSQSLLSYCPVQAQNILWWCTSRGSRTWLSAGFRLGHILADTASLIVGAGSENGSPAWTSSCAQRTRGRSRRALSWPRSCRWWRTTTRPRSSTCTSPTTAAPSSPSTLCGRPPPSPSTGSRSAGGTASSHGRRPLTSPSQMRSLVMIRRTPCRSGRPSKYVHAFVFTVYRRTDACLAS